MKRLLIAGAILLGGSLQAQTHLHDAQTKIEFTSRGASNYTLVNLNSGGYAMASIAEDASGEPTGGILITTLNSLMAVEHSLEMAMPDANGFGVAYEPQDIIQNSNGDLIICGKVIVEAGDRGGFLMQINYDARGAGLTYDWSKLYPYTVGPGRTAVMSLNGVIETDDGYAVIGQSQALPANGILIGTRRDGNINWARDIRDDQHGNTSTVLNDIVSIGGGNFAVVGTVNSFPADDDDIMICKFNAFGVVQGNQVYERLGESDFDNDFTFHEMAKGLVYDRSNNTLTVAGMVQKKIHGICVAAEYRRILSLQVEANTLNPIWAHEYEIPTDLLIINEGLSSESIAYDPVSATFAIAGWVNNFAFSLVSEDNGFILRIDALGYSTDLRMYGNKTGERLNKIILSDATGEFVAAGTRSPTKNQPWLVESFESINEECEQISGFDETYDVEVDIMSGLIMTVFPEVSKITPIPRSPLVNEVTICPRIPLMRSSSVEENKMDANIYPTITSGLVIIESTVHQSYRVYDISSGKILQFGTIKASKEQLDLSNLAKGIYLLELEGKGSDKTIKRIIKQ